MDFHNVLMCDYFQSSLFTPYLVQTTFSHTFELYERYSSYRKFKPKIHFIKFELRTMIIGSITLCGHTDRHSVFMQIRYANQSMRVGLWQRCSCQTSMWSTWEADPSTSRGIGHPRRQAFLISSLLHIIGDMVYISPSGRNTHREMCA